MKDKNVVVIVIVSIIVCLLILLVGFGFSMIVLFNKFSTTNTEVKNKPVDVIPKVDKKETVNLNETFTLFLAESVKVKDTNLEIELLATDDSRCPAGVECYWEGEIEYSLIVNNTSIKLGTVTKKEMDYKNYTIKLADDNNNTSFVKLKVVKK